MFGRLRARVLLQDCPKCAKKENHALLMAKFAGEEFYRQVLKMTILRFLQYVCLIKRPMGDIFFIF